MAVINLKYYKGEDLYHDGCEQTVLKYIKRYPNNYEKAFDENIDFPIYYYLSPIRANILNWYPFKPKSSILEIGAGMGSITKLLCEKVSKVTSVELSRERAEAIERRCSKHDNLEIIVANFNDIVFTAKYDYITLIGVLEYAPSYTKHPKPFEEFLKNIKKLLKPNGKLLIAIENRFGLKYWSGAIEDHTGKAFIGIRNYENTDNVKTFGKNEISTILNDSGFIRRNFYYPLPDYKFPEIIISDNYANKDIFYRPYYLNCPSLLFDEKKIMTDIATEGMLPFFSNSFFIEASPSDNALPVKVDFVKFSNYRLNKYKVMTIINGKKVYKKPMNSEAEQHINEIIKINDKLIKQEINVLPAKQKNNCIQMKFVKNRLYNDMLVEQIKKNDMDKFYKHFQKLCDAIKNSSIESKDYEKTVFDQYDIEVPLSVKKKYFYLKDGYIDMNMFNCFLIAGKIKFFDQEWYEKNVPYEYIIQRGLRLFIHHNNLENLLDYNEVLERLNIKDDFFDVLEANFQKKVANKNAILFSDENGNYIDVGIDYEKNVLLNGQNYLKNIEKEHNEILNSKLYNYMMKIRIFKNKFFRLKK